MIKSITGENSI